MKNSPEYKQLMLIVNSLKQSGFSIPQIIGMINYHRITIANDDFRTFVAAVVDELAAEFITELEQRIE